MQSMFGDFISEKRKEKGILLRSMAEQLKISNPYFSDIERERRNPPNMNMLEKISLLLCLTQEDRETMFDLAGKERNEVSPDLPEYIMFKSA
jgi:transcriptional regulator with XRE-family HTH domain